MKVDVVSSEAHFSRHMLPIWDKLPPELKGDVHPLKDPGHVTRPPMGRVAMVAGWQDVAPLRGRCNMIYVEHGAGQTYVDRPYDPHYSGSMGARHRGVVGYIAPSQTVADRWVKPAAAVGCPKMDRYYGMPEPKEPTVCFAFHWPCMVTQETRSAWPHYERLFDRITRSFWAQGFTVVGQEHPKWRGLLRSKWESMHLDVFSTDDEVFRKASILIVDNSSLAYEFASLGRPVVLLNAPWYRRDVEHGLRFWSHVPGVQIDFPEELETLNLWDLVHDTPLRQESERLRIRAVEHAYAHTDGSSSQLAADFVTELVG